MSSRIALVLLGVMAASACRSGTTYVPVDEVSEAAALPARFEALPCGERPAASAPAELVSVLGRLRSYQLTPCGQLVYLDPAGDLYFSGAALEPPVRLAEAVFSVQVARRGDQLLARDADGWSWIRTADGERVRLDARSLGFVRLGDEERAWACVGNELGTVDAEGFHPRVSQVRLCERVWAAAEAPVLVFIGPDFLLRAIDLGDGRVTDLYDVDFIAASSDQIALSRDGRILYHQPGRVAAPRVGVFDLARPSGDRLIGAPRIDNALYGVVHAPASGHAAAMTTEEGVVLLGEDGLLRLYEEVSFVALAPEGERVLVMASPDVRAAPWDVLVAAPGRSYEAIGTLPGPLTRLARSIGHGSVVGWGPAPGRFDPEIYALFRWRDGALLELPDQRRIPEWVSEEGATVTRLDGDVVIRAPSGETLHRWPERWGPSVYAAGEDAVLVWLRDSERAELIRASTTGPSARALYDGPPLNGVVVDRAGERAVWLQVAIDEVDPTQLRSRLIGGSTR